MNGIELRFELALGRFRLAVAIDAPGAGVTAVFGPSGSGKTTLLRCVAGLERAPTGRVCVNGQCWQDSASGRFVPAHRRSLGYVFQDAALFPHLTVLHNLRYAVRRGRAGPGRLELERAVSWMGIEALLERRPDRLSGGEKQRVALARALLTHPAILLMDEPLASLDETARTEILPYLERLHRELSIPVLYVSHSRAEVLRLADHVVLLERGRVRGAGPVAQIAARPDLPFGAEAELGTIAYATVSGRDDEFDLTRLEIPGGRLSLPGGQALRAGERIRVRFLARDVSLTLERPERTSILNVLPARVVEIREAGSTLPLVVLDAGGTPLLARISRKSLVGLALAPGIELYAQIKAVALLD